MGKAINRSSRAKLLTKVTQLEKLVRISVTINSTIDLNPLIKLIIETAADLLACEAVSILLYNEESSSLYFTESSSSDVKKLAETHVPLQNSLAGTIFRENKALILNNVEQDPRHFSLAARHVNFQTHSLMGVPMRSRDRITGVVEALNKKNGYFDQDDLDILEVIASQAAVAIQNAKLVRDLQDAYNTTLEGWSSALDLRDRETQGHARRVAAMTLELAGKMGISEDLLIIFRQGALLHDIGKMGIPDNILNKPGLLTEAEQKTMRQHPFFAYELLAPITYLRPALDIPYCHHEKWDGSGYPRGLKGEAIPMAARIFAVIDVWDALTSERPYRSAWPKEKARSYIQEHAGSDFDPEVVKIFMQLLFIKDAEWLQPGQDKKPGVFD
jgi:HD-GYP domain-containing protein (c-di-GMP phosphodiesterase class II)